MQRAVVAVAVTVAAACGDAERRDASSGSAAAPVGSARSASVAAVDPHARELAALLASEEQRRRDTDFATLPPSDAALGPDPYRIVHTRDGTRIGVLRGDDRVVVVGADGLLAQGLQAAKLAAPRSASGIAVSANDEVLVVGEDDPAVWQYAIGPHGLQRVATLAVDVLGMRDVAWAPDGKTAYVVDDHDGRLLALTMSRGGAPGIQRTLELGRCHAPIRVATVADYVATDCLLDHAIEIRRGPAETPSGAIVPPVARIVHDGPIWSLALAAEPGGGLLVAAGGIEDHPLVRDDGAFGYIDSFVYVYRLAPGASAPTRLAAVNTAALGTVTPKWLTLHRGADGSVEVTTAGYAQPGAADA